MANESAIIFKLDASQVETEAANSARTLEALDKAGIKTGKTVERLESKTRKSGKEFKDYDRTVSKTESTMTSLNGVVGKLATGIAALGLGAAIKSTADYAAQVDILSERLGVSAEQLSSTAYATKRYGVDLEKLSDIYKDMSDRVGDFIQTGGGPMVDFFEQVAPKVGVTAEQFRELNGADALQLYVDSLERANVSQNDMTFYMEAIASDASALLPLLKDNGDALATLAGEAERTGNVIGEDYAKSARQAKQATADLMGQAQGLINQTTQALIPAYTTATQVLGDNLDVVVNTSAALASVAIAIRGATAAQAALNAVTKANPWVLLATAVVGVGTALYTLSKRQEESITLTRENAAAVDEFTASLQGATRAELQNQKVSLVEKLNAEKAAVEELNAELERREQKLGPAFGRDAYTRGIIESDTRENLSAAQQAAAKYEAQIAALEEQLASLDETQGKIGGSNGTTKTLTDKLTDASDAYQALRQQYAPLKVAAEDYAKQQEQINLLYQDGQISESQKQQALNQLRKNYNSLKLEIRGVTAESEKLQQLESRLAATRYNVLDTSPQTPQGAVVTQPNRGDYLGATGNQQYHRDSANAEYQTQRNQLDAERDSALTGLGTADLDLHQKLAYEKEIRKKHAEDVARIEQEKNARIAEIETGAHKARLSDTANLFGGLASMSATFAGDSSALTQGLVAFQKAASITQSIMAIQTGIANAASNPWPMNLGAMASVVSATAGIVSTIQGVSTPSAPTFSASGYSGAYDKGGEIPSGKWGIVGEIGPEIVQGPAKVTGRKETAKMMSGKPPIS